MSLRRYLLASSIVCASIGCAGHGAPPPERGPSEARIEEMTPEEMEARWRKAGTPAAAHKLLEPLAGKFEVKSKMWMEPGAEPMLSTGSAEHTWILGGRFLKQRFSGKVHGQPYDGVGVLGYDNVKGKYVHSWIDSMGTGMMISECYYDPASKELKMSGSFTCPVTEEEMSADLVTRIVNKHEHVMEMYHDHPVTGQRYKAMELTYRKTS